MAKHLEIKIFGRVQGVFFREESKKMAKELDIVGFARNEAEGAVYMEVEGEEKNLSAFLDWCKKGPAGASVTNIEVREGAAQGFKSFTIQWR
ncbi:MAG: acylphosphatase [Candidatus Liptonbacteria bacterium]|nr:acylphosphatase [Candidatus Liptonbacteria bacterium]